MMRISPRYTIVDDKTVLRGLVLEVESEAESKLIDECCGATVDADGLIASGQFEVRLSDGYVTHYVYLQAN